MAGMKYNRYLITGISLLTILLLFLFAGVVSETESEMLRANGIDASERGYGAILLGIGLPLILTMIYIFARNRKGEPMKNEK
ncbi:hypothetical protein [Methanolobus sp. WCC4]|uniref:hypothetical protein n=1 Tax=Methanolobus sp. WCC4 TaxID=3125784 RepID=UPI0030FAA8F0